MPGWPERSAWERLRSATGGRLAAVSSPFAACGQGTADAPACKTLLRDIQDPFFIGDQPGLTQTQRLDGCLDVDAQRLCRGGARMPPTWRRRSNFARHPQPAAGGEGRRPQLPGRLERAGFAADLDPRHGTRSSCTTPSSPQGSQRGHRSRPCALGAGAIWGDAYAAVTTQGRTLRAGRRLHHRGRRRPGAERRLRQLLQALRPAAASLLEAEVVTADGAVRIANACTEPRAVLGAEGRRGRQLRRGHAADAAHARAAAAVRRGVRHGARPTRTGVPRADRRFMSLLLATACSTRTGARRCRSARTTGSRSAWCSRVSTSARALPPCGSRSSTGSRERAATMRSTAAVRSCHAGARFWDAGVPASTCPASMVRDERPGASADQRLLERRPAARPAGSCTPTSRPGCRRRCCRATAQARLVDALFAARATARDAALQQGPGRRAAAEIAARARHGDEPRGAGRLRARHQRAGRRRRPSRGARPRARSRRAAAAQRRGVARQRWPRCARGAGSRRLRLGKRLLPARLAAGVLGHELPAAARGQGRYDPDGLFFVHHGVGSEGWSEDGFTRLQG